VGVSPFPGDRTADYLEAAGIMVLRQPAASGLSDLWNRIVRFAFFDKSNNGPYEFLVISNNDVLIPPGALGATKAVLSHSPNSIATAVSQNGGATSSLGSPRGMPLDEASKDTLSFAEHSLNYQVVQNHLMHSTLDCSSTPSRVIIPFVPGKKFIAFFWGLSRDLTSRLILKDGSGRLFNTTASLNFGQETELLERYQQVSTVSEIISEHRLMLGTAAYIHHFRGQTLGGQCTKVVSSSLFSLTWSHLHEITIVVCSSRLSKRTQRLCKMADWASCRPNLSYYWLWSQR
jgi:hypothetical protein